MTLTDTHCHLNFNKFDPDRQEVLDRAAQAGVEKILIPGTDLASSRAAIDLARNHPMLYSAVGIHPTEVDKLQVGTLQVDTLAGLRELAKNSRVVAIGEIGLDYYWDTAPHELQRDVLKEQLAMAAEYEIPVVIHLREKGDAVDGACAEDLMKILEEWVAGLESRKSRLVERPGVLHSFSGSRQTAERAIGLNFFIGITGPVTYRKDRQELVAALPLEKLLVETDAPFLAPHPHRGKRNEPAYVRLIADKIAVLHSLDPAQAALATSGNAAKLFDW